MTAFKTVTCNHQIGHRLINSKFPPTTLFDDVADANELEAVYLAQQITNPRINTMLGNLSLLPTEDIPLGINGCSYATSAFTHVNPDGSRFSDGSFGVLYLAENIETAIKETSYHQELIFQNIPGLKYDRIVMRGLKFTFSGQLVDLCSFKKEIYHETDYSKAQAIGGKLKVTGMDGFQYNSVRNPGNLCWGLLTPKGVEEAIQTKHYEYIYDGEEISSINRLSKI